MDNVLFYIRQKMENDSGRLKENLNQIFFTVYKITIIIQDDESDSEPEKSAQGAAVGTMNKEEDKRVRGYININDL